MLNTAGRHPATVEACQWLEFDHLPSELQAVASSFAENAKRILALVPDGPQLTLCIRAMVQAKDCAVRAVINARREYEAAEAAQP